MFNDLLEIIRLVTIKMLAIRLQLLQLVHFCNRIKNLISRINLRYYHSFQFEIKKKFTFIYLLFRLNLMNKFLIKFFIALNGSNNLVIESITRYYKVSLV